MASTLPGVLRSAAAVHGARPAVVDGERTLSFQDLLDHVRATAAGYIALGVEPGDRVCIWAPNSADWMIAGLAASYAGATLVPINSRYTGHEAQEIAVRTHARIFVVANGFLGRDQVGELRAAGELPELGAIVTLPPLPGGVAVPAENVVDFGSLAELGVELLGDADARAEAVSADDVADILFTSGTTGRSKGAMSAHRQTIAVSAAWAEIGGVSAEDRYLVVNPFFHSFGYKIGIVVGLLTGATLYPVGIFDVDTTMELIERERITLLPGAPTIFTSLLEAPGRGSRDLSSLRLSITGAAVVPVVLIERMRAAAPEGLGIDHVYTAFGMTEAVVATMCREGDADVLVATTCGRAIPGAEVRIAAVGGNEPLPAGDEGEVLVRGEIVMLGYLDDPAATADAIDEDGWLHTGDIGKVDEAGNLQITDRLKDMYISGGFNVYPAEIEQVLARHEAVADVAVIGVPDDRMGEVGQAYVVRRAGSSVEAADLIAFARERLANYKAPRLVEFVDTLPRNASGKVLKIDLRDTKKTEQQ
ncbi:fatty acid--CoA ligase [Nocardioides marmoriginsengisoli]|uniref:Fatty acid--CoA ligase n=1 Tax=Nocardioides marmoriginsengisoli TaxID=661483 RepID=A0A3N0CAJ9_9ACTN|nr:FadD3 family acyl-CoA ligase [Nocardioides marmoriginsengisoli]RNL59993.1 fatty acid--CoA ligase [Nocardioides marmoriginsengisoli]